MECVPPTAETLLCTLSRIVRGEMSSKNQHYEIRIQGHVRLDWSSWFDDLMIRHDECGETVVTGMLPDQTALHGVLQKIRDLGLTLVAVKRIPD